MSELSVRSSISMARSRPPTARPRLADVDRLNAWFGGYWLTLRAIARVLRQRRASGPLVIVDIGGGRGHFGRRLVAWAGRRVWTRVSSHRS